MKFLVLGCNGMAGHLISLYLKENGHSVTGFARKRSPFSDTVTGDAKDQNLLAEVIKNGNFDTVINCIGILNKFAEEDKASACYLNAYLPHFLADLTSDTNTQIIHMSTDCVFSGKRGKYTEDDLPDGETFYDRTKALGELTDGKNLTLRNSAVGPDINENGIGLLNWFMKQTGDINGYTGAMWTGLTTLQLAKVMEKGSRERVHGLYNMVPDRAISKYELLCLFNRYLRNGDIDIHPVAGVCADKSLVRTHWDFNMKMPDYEQMVRELADWMQMHKALYPHYQL